VGSDLCIRHRRPPRGRARARGGERAGARGQRPPPTRPRPDELVRGGGGTLDTFLLRVRARAREDRALPCERRQTRLGSGLAMPEDDFVTLGVRFRTPCPPEFATAIGRVIYNFLSLEGQVAALLVETQESDMTEARELMAGQKASRVRRAAKRHDRRGDASVAQALRAAADAFDSATQDERNALGHAKLFAADRTVEGDVAPGLAMADGAGAATSATKPEEILAMASRIEAAREPVTAARRAARAASP
jgi:hypothetical protein